MATKILIVDDDERLAQALEQLLNLEGYQASIALSAEAALERFRKQPHAHDETDKVAERRA